VAITIHAPDGHGAKKGNMKTSVKTSVKDMMNIHRRICSIEAELEKLTGWSEQELRDTDLAESMKSLSRDLNNAAGRSTTIIMRLHALT